jgi:hypothetical protein
MTSRWITRSAFLALFALGSTQSGGDYDSAVASLSPLIDEVLPLGSCDGNHVRLVIARAGRDDVLAQPYLQWVSDRHPDSSRVVKSQVIDEVVGLFNVAVCSTSYDSSCFTTHLKLGRISHEGTATLELLPGAEYKFTVDSTWERR